MRDLIQLLESQENLQEIGFVGKTLAGGMAALVAAGGAAQAQTPRVAPQQQNVTAAGPSDSQIAATRQAQTSQEIQSNQRFDAWLESMRKVAENMTAVAQRTSDPVQRSDIQRLQRSVERRILAMDGIWSNLPAQDKATLLSYIQQLGANPAPVNLASAEAFDKHTTDVNLKIRDLASHALARARIAQSRASDRDVNAAIARDRP